MNNEQSDNPPPNILIVDDDPGSLRLMLQLLSQAGFKGRPARDGQQALSAARLTHPDLILLDMVMPPMTGEEVCQALKADEATRDIPVIFISGLNQAFDKVRAFSVGGVDYISKPFQNEEILARIKTHLTLSKLQKELQQRNTELQQEIVERERIELKIQEMNQSLHQRISELTVLNLIAQTITTVTDMPTTLKNVVTIVNHLFDAYSTSVSLLDTVSQEIKVTVSFERSGPDFSVNGPTNEGRSWSGEGVIQVNNSLLKDHLFKDKRPMSFSQAQSGPVLTLVQGLFQAGNIQSFLIVPLQARAEVFGFLTLAIDQPEREFTPTEERLAEIIAGQIAGAVKQAWLFEEEHRQRQIAESLREVATVLSSSLDRQTVLNIIFEQLQQVLPYQGASVWLIEDEELVIVEAVGCSTQQLSYRLSLKSKNPLTEVLRQQQVVILTNMDEAESWPNWLKLQAPGSWMGAPLGVGRVYFGLLAVEWGQVGIYHQENAKIFQAFANQAAIAIENARLYEQVQTMAVDAERQRLARELHDSVTQSLYSLTLLTSGWAAMAQQGTLDAQQIVEHFNQLEEISLQGLKEMRLLLHQLRPSVLDEVGLVRALQHRLDTVEQRVNITARLLTLGPVDELPLTLAEQLFFIAQESLNNSLRHAEASEVSVRIELEDRRLMLVVTDNGSGFDPAAPSFGLGLESMRERTEAIAGQLEITSTPQQGTTVKITIALRPEEDV